VSSRSRSIIPTNDDEDQDSLRSDESDEEAMRTPLHHMNKIQDYLNSSPLDHGPPELSTLSEKYGDPSSPSPRTPAAKSQPKV
jgi:hypothetical protein